MIGRRWFAKGVVATPIALGAGKTLGNVGGVSAAPNVANLGGITDVLQGASQYIEPAGVKSYYAARQVAQASARYKYMLSDANRNRDYANPNIMSLRSVAPQHKLRMLVDARIASDKAEQTFAQKLMDQFGVREFFEKQQGNYPQVAGESGGGY